MSFLCVCGHVIKDNLYPSPLCGDLKWQPEYERASNDASEAAKDFFAAVENGKKEKWLREFFSVGDHKLQISIRNLDGTESTEEVDDNFYLTADLSTIVTDIFSRFENREGHIVYRCPECERLYIQREYRSNDYECYEKRPG